MLRAARRLAVIAHRALDVPHRLSAAIIARELTAFYCVYRRRNAGTVAALLDSLDDPLVALWALDETAPELRRLTVGEGPGTKFELLNHLINVVPTDHRWAVFSDDDYEITRGTLTEFVGLARQAQFSIAQPAHVPNSYWSHHVTVSQPRSLARRTRLVEIGPVFAVNPQASGVLPFPDGIGMGWGLDFAWSRDPALSLGVVDQVRIRHLAPVGAAYQVPSVDLSDEEHATQETERVGPVWRPWRIAPPWTSRTAGTRRRAGRR